MRTIPIPDNGTVNRLSFSADGRVLLACATDVQHYDHVVCRVDLAAPEPAGQSARCVAEPAWMADGRRYFQVLPGRDVLWCSDLVSRQTSPPVSLRLGGARTGTRVVRVAGDAEHVAVAGSGDDFARGRGDTLVAHASSGRVRVFRFPPGREPAPVDSPLETTEMPWVVDLAFRAGERALAVTASARPNFPYHAWDWRTGAELARLPVERERAGRLVLSPDGNLLATATDRRTVLWDTHAWAPALALPDDRDPSRDLAFAPDGSLLATVDRSDRVRLWDTATGAVRADYCWRPGEVPGAVAVSPDGLTAAAAYTAAVVLWDLE